MVAVSIAEVVNQLRHFRYRGDLSLFSVGSPVAPSYLLPSRLKWPKQLVFEGNEISPREMNPIYSECKKRFDFALRLRVGKLEGNSLPDLHVIV